MRFEQALQAMREGKKVREKSWNTWECLFIKKKMLYSADMDDGKIFYYVADLSMDADYLLAEDWEIVEDEPQS